MRLHQGLIAGLLLGALILLPRPAEAGTTGKVAVPPRPGEVTEMWEGDVLTSRYRVTFCISGSGRVRGASLLRTRSGQVDVYHLNGTVKDGYLEASHSSGHRFSGRLRGDSVQGKLRLHNGMTFNITSRRILDVPVTEDCAPVPEDGWRLSEE